MHKTQNVQTTTTKQQEKKIVVDALQRAEAQEIEENPEHLRKLLKAFEDQDRDAGNRKDRMQDLMKRKSSKDWSPAQTARQVRRYMSVSKEQEQALAAIDHIKHKLEQVTQAKPNT